MSERTDKPRHAGRHSSGRAGRRAPAGAAPGLHPVLRLRLAIAFIERTLTAMVIPVLAVYLAGTLGPGPAGLLIVASVVVAAAVGLSSGHFADTLGRRRALLVGSVAMTVAFGGMAVAASPLWSSPLAVFGCYLLQAAAGSFIQPVHDAVIIDVTVPEQRKVVYTINYWSFNLALAAGALLAGFLYGGHLVGLFAGAALCSLGATLLTYRFLGETAPPRAEVAAGAVARGPAGMVGGVVRGYLMPLRDRRFMALFAAMTLVLGLEMQRTSGYIAVRVAQEVPEQSLLPVWGWLPHVTGIQLVGVLQAVNTVGVALLALVSERVLRRLDDRRRIVGGVGLFTAACAVLATNNTAWLLLVSVLVLTVGELLHIPVMQTVLADVIPERARAKYLAVFNLNVRGGMAIASLSLTAGAVLPAGGIAAAYGLLGLGAILLYRSLLAGPALAAARSTAQSTAQSTAGSPAQPAEPDGLVTVAGRELQEAQ
jgi:DHA1 family multidrug resistance protein B-like MFS transporter